MAPFSAVKVFSTTMARDRMELGERITEWLKQHPEFTVVDRVTTQTSDREFHCLTITLFLAGDATKYLTETPEPRMSAPRPAGIRPGPSNYTKR